MSVFGDHAPDGQHTDRFFLFHRHDSNDVNNKILLSAIITVSAVLFLVIVLHIYARFLLHRRLTVRRLPISARSVDAGAPTGLAPSAVAALPIITVQTASGGGSVEGGAYGECAVCLSGLEVGEPARLLPNCNHAFHVKCIDTWLGSHSTCPICRAGVEPVASLVLPLSREPPANSPSPGKVGGPSSRLSSLRRMMSGEIPTRRVQQVELEDQDGDVESQSQRQ